MDDRTRRHAAAALAQALVPWLTARALGRPVALFASMPDEVETRVLDRALRDAGIERALPAFAGDAMWFVPVPRALLIDDLPAGPLGIRTPPGRDAAEAGARGPHENAGAEVVPLAQLGALVVPGLAFDARGGRLGRGRGYYDRALASVEPDRAIGAALDEQLVDAVPCAPHDVRLAWLWTPSRGVTRTFRDAP